MNATVYQAAKRAGLTDRQSRFLAVYVESEGYRDAARELGIAESAAKHLSVRLRRRLGLAHMSAVVAHVLTKVAN